MQRTRRKTDQERLSNLRRRSRRIWMKKQSNAGTVETFKAKVRKYKTKAKKTQSRKKKKNFLEIIDKRQIGSSAIGVNVTQKLNLLPSSGTPLKCLRNGTMKKLKRTNARDKLLKEPTVVMVKIDHNRDAAKDGMAEDIAHTKLPADACEVAAQDNYLCLTNEARIRGFKPMKLNLNDLI